MGERFDSDKVRGGVGEKISELWMSKNMDSYVDVREDRRYQYIDVDYVAKECASVYHIEVKTDWVAYKTGNVALEMSSKGHDGCFKRTKADLIYIYIPQTDKLYEMNVRKTRGYIERNAPALLKMGDNAEGYLLKIGDLEESGCMNELRWEE